MENSPRFNYIITIHNKENMIEKVIMCVLMCCRDTSHIYPVIDGCTDKTESIIDGLISKYSGLPITKVYTPDVHELLSINAGLRAANHDGDGFNIILQDDVLLADYALESKIVALYQWAGSSLGYVSFRLGANFTNDAATSNNPVPYCDYIENAYGHGIENAEVLLPGHFAYRTVPIKSPVCIPFGLVRTIGYYEEELAPYGHDDLDYAIRSNSAGKKSGVFGVRFYSDVKWGGTRTNPHPELNRVIDRNMQYIRSVRGSEIAAISKAPQGGAPIAVPNLSSEVEDHRGMEMWKSTRDKLKAFEQEARSDVWSRIRSRLNTTADHSA